MKRYARLRDVPAGRWRSRGACRIRGEDRRLRGAPGREQRAESEVQVAELGLRRRLVALVVVPVVVPAVLFMRGEKIMQVPDRMADRALLADQQYGDEYQLQECAPHRRPAGMREESGVTA